MAGCSVNKDEIIAEIGKHRLVPVVTIENAKNAVSLGAAIIAGGLPLAEITLRTGAALEAIKILTRAFPDLLVGAGTVLSAAQAQEAVNAGAKFIVSPGFNPKVVDYCVWNGVPITPGVSSPTLIEMALERNLSVVKFFPAEPLGGMAFLKAIAAPYPNVKFIPTGGINQKNLADYLAYDRVHACGGSWMVASSLIAAGKFGEITKLIKEARSQTTAS